MINWVILVILTAGALAQQHQHDPAAPVPPARVLPGLGSHHHKIATTSAEAQRLFDQGLTLAYGFNHGQAIRQFERAAALDPRAAMPLWGIALAYGPNINDFEMDRERAKTADEYVKKALALTSSAHPRERAYVEALSKRYSSDPAADLKTLQHDYKDAMAILADPELTADDAGISINRLNELCANDWGWWRSVTMVAEQTHKRSLGMVQENPDAGLDHVPDRVRHLIAELQRAPKSRRWKLRAPRSNPRPRHWPLSKRAWLSSTKPTPRRDKTGRKSTQKPCWSSRPSQPTIIACPR